MTILAKSLLTLVSSHLVSLVLLTVWHGVYYLSLSNTIVVGRCLYGSSFYHLIFSENAFEGLNVGTLCAGMIMVVFLEILRAVFLARVLITKLPKPRK